ncbi:hypothetical protein PROFUN_14759 [Planoprotostelium fungivorum]|uniref:Uncharacterized protein n=1 Tax=Planoprotostelium fungivorum TaxID=1890364 RepID=A0A2P6MYQ4_9EUKA|nr:hypothetical protein PROFUN_14759 [Planoprotostelium fungivorum]
MRMPRSENREKTAILFLSSCLQATKQCEFQAVLDVNTSTESCPKVTISLAYPKKHTSLSIAFNQSLKTSNINAITERVAPLRLTAAPQTGDVAVVPPLSGVLVDPVDWVELLDGFGLELIDVSVDDNASASPVPRSFVHSDDVLNRGRGVGGR